MTADIIAMLIKSCSAIQSFSLDSTAPAGTAISYLRYEQILEALEQHDNTLEELVVTSSHTYQYGESPVIKPTSLLNFKKLEHLHVLYCLVTDGDHAEDSPVPDLSTMLPPSIKTLKFEILCDPPFEATTSALANLLHQKYALLPHLESVHVVNYTPAEKHGFRHKYCLPVDLPFLSRLAQEIPGLHFDYTLFHHDLQETARIEELRKQMLRHPQGNELIKHSVCLEGKRWSAVLSRDVGTPSLFWFNVFADEARREGWMADHLSEDELMEKMKAFSERERINLSARRIENYV